MDGWEEQLVSWGVDRPYAARLVLQYDEERIASALSYCESLTERPGAGLVVLAVREGRTPARGQSSVALLDRQAEFGREIQAWLREHFPQWNREEGNRTHAAAIACVIRLRQRHGWPLSARTHGPEIRAAVKAFNREHLEER